MIDEEKAIELGYEFGIDSGDGCFEFGMKDLHALIARVEQATLERAAVECETSEMYRGSIFATRIRNLKGTN